MGHPGMGIFSIAILLFLVMDPLGNIPLFVAVLKDVDRGRRPRIIAREHVIALALLAMFLFGGQLILSAFCINPPAMCIAGGILLFLMSIKMIFPTIKEHGGESRGSDPFIVPLAIPFIAGPSSLTTVMLLGGGIKPLLALLLAWAASLGILLLSDWSSRLLGDRVLVAIQRLMGMVLATIAVQMFLNGMGKFLHLPPV